MKISRTNDNFDPTRQRTPDFEQEIEAVFNKRQRKALRSTRYFRIPLWLDNISNIGGTYALPVTFKSVQAIGIEHDIQ